MNSDDFDVRTRYLVNLHFSASGHAPTIDALRSMHGGSRQQIEASLVRLERDHRLLLYPGTREVWVAHPYSAVSNGYWVASEQCGWWGNCAFCSLGIAAMSQTDVTIDSHFGGEDRPVTLRIVNGTAMPNDIFLHVPLPIAEWHDNVIRTCGSVHYFPTREAVAAWCRRHHMDVGQIVPIAAAWRLAQAWYGDYLAEGWRPRDNVETNALLQACGFNGAFWRLPEHRLEPVHDDR